MRRGWIGVVLVTVAAVAARGEDPAVSYEDEIRAWQARRVERLKSDTGWLSVAGLFWLEPGENRFGSAPDNDIVLPSAAPPHAGTFVHAGGATWVRAAAGAGLRIGGRPIDEQRLRTDAEDSTDVLELGRLRMFVIVRGGRHAIRLRDPNAAARRNFHGIDTYPIDPAYRVTARFEPYAPPKKVPIANVIGTVDTMLSPGALVFQLGSRELRLDPLLEEPDATSLFLIFKDETSGSETYGAGRFLYTDLPVDGRVVVDFNRAYNPPCVFTEFATCPLPPPQNDLEAAVRAGEKDYAHP
jgi:uncharacterized protein (DUF1684 family)